MSRHLGHAQSLEGRPAGRFEQVLRGAGSRDFAPRPSGIPSLASCLYFLASRRRIRIRGCREGTTVAGGAWGRHSCLPIRTPIGTRAGTSDETVKNVCPTVGQTFLSAPT